MKFKGIPIFRIVDLENAKEFYVQFLGFKVDWENRFGTDKPVYMQVSKKDLILNLSENKRFQTEVIIFVETHGIDKFHMVFLDRKSAYSVPVISKTNWNYKTNGSRRSFWRFVEI